MTGQPEHDQLTTRLYSSDPTDQADAHLALQQHDDGPSVREAAANDRCWPLEKEGE